MEMTIKFSKYSFDGPFTSVDALEDRSGVYMVLCEMDQGYRVLDVGESKEVKSRVESHDRVSCWEDNCQGTLAYAAHYTPRKQQFGRRAIELRIRLEHGRLPCGEG
jgi:hypothetical protein